MRLGGVISWTQGECGSDQNNSNDCATDVNADGTTNVMVYRKTQEGIVLFIPGSHL